MLDHVVNEDVSLFCGQMFGNFQSDDYVKPTTQIKWFGKICARKMSGGNHEMFFCPLSIYAKCVVNAFLKRRLNPWSGAAANI